MHIAERYSRSLGVEIGNPVLQEHFFPIQNCNYITVHNSDKVPAKNYSYWPDVIKIIKPELQKRNIKIFQIGTKEDPEIEGVDHFFNFTTFKQSFFIIKNALMHVGCDSCPGHIASAYNIPTVTPFSHTFSSTCFPIWNGDKAGIIESHRNGNKPSFSNKEDPKTIDIIKPEEIAQKCFEKLKFKTYINRKTIFIGEKFLHKTIDIIPENLPKSNLDVSSFNVRVRMDLCFNEENLKFILNASPKKIDILTEKPINHNLIGGFKEKINKIVYTAESFDEKFLNFLKQSGLKFELNCSNKKNLLNERLKFFNFDIVECNELNNSKKLMSENIKLFEFNKEKLKIDFSKFYINGEHNFTFLEPNLKKQKFWIDMPYCIAYSEERKP